MKSFVYRQNQSDRDKTRFKKNLCEISLSNIVSYVYADDMSMKKSFCEQCLFIFGSLLTCAFILASSRMDPQLLDSQHLEMKLNAVTQSVVGQAEAIRNFGLSEAADRLPTTWTTFLNSSYIADLRDQVATNGAEPVVGALPIQTAACSTQELRHILQGEMSPLDVPRGLTTQTNETQMDDTRPSAEQARIAVREARLDHFRVLAILDSVYNFSVQILASQMAPATEGLKAIVVVEHKCKPIDDPSTLLPINPKQDMTVDPTSEEAKLEDATLRLDHGVMTVSQLQSVTMSTTRF